MKHISLLKNKLTGQHIAIDRPIYDAKGQLNPNAKRREYNSLDGMVNCLSEDFELNTSKPISVYLYDYSTSDKAEINRRLGIYFKKVEILN